MKTEQDIFNANILIVDDVEANVLLLEQVLTDTGYQHVSLTMDPYAVFELHHTNRYDLILLDLQMPGMDGFEVMEGLRLNQSEDDLSILVVTVQIELRHRALAAGAEGFITKPINLSDIEKRIHNMLKAHYCTTVSGLK